MDDEPLGPESSAGANRGNVEQPASAYLTPLSGSPPPLYLDTNFYIERERGAKERRKMQNRRAQQTFRRTAPAFLSSPLSSLHLIASPTHIRTISYHLTLI